MKNLEDQKSRKLESWQAERARKTDLLTFLISNLQENRRFSLWP